MIEIGAETLFPLNATPDHIAPASAGRKVSKSAVIRWATVGVRGRDGTRVVLETVRIGGRIYCSREALRRFFARLNDSPGQANRAASPPASSGGATRAARELERLGFRGR